MEIRVVVVTGGAGFVGKAIVRTFRKMLPLCHLTVIDPADFSVASRHDLSVNFVRANVTSLQGILDALVKVRPAVVVHTAGMGSPLSERYARRLERDVFRINVDGTRNILRAAEAAGCAAFVYTSSFTAIVDDMSRHHPNVNKSFSLSLGPSIYVESKEAHAEELVLSTSRLDLRTCALRPSVVCEEGDNQLVPSIHPCIVKGETPYVIGDCHNLWDVTYAGNVADAHVFAAENLLSSMTAAAESPFIQNNEPVAFRDFSLVLWNHFWHVPPFEIVIPVSAAWFAGLLAEAYTWISGLPTTLGRGSVKDACSVRYANGLKGAQNSGLHSANRHRREAPNQL